MAFFAHMGAGFAMKPLAPKVPVGVLVAAGMWLDLVCFALMGLGVGGESILAWTHGLFMSGVWSIFVGVAAGLIMKNPRGGIVIGAAVFSHWIIDFITHPMAGGDLQPDIPLFLEGSPKVGLGLYRDMTVAIIVDIASLLAGIAVYVYSRLHLPKPPVTPDK
ncbi:MAG: hypothetical protein A2014_08255 [Spirochaetes bacterium GWF1_49_6]|nr:MAG: hypothetical protein A2014_08255 [Spirochaetes bacterium GWF1_49_6]